MQKNTEYGAMVLLSASPYGKPNKVEEDQTTTGNETGVVFPYNIEWVAAQHTDGLMERATYDDRYINYYITNNQHQKDGDAYYETSGWHGASNDEYTSNFWTYGTGLGAGSNGYNTTGGIIRNIGSGIFSYSNKYTYAYVTSTWRGTSYGTNYDGVTNLDKAYKSRLVVVNGEGL